MKHLNKLLYALIVPIAFLSCGDDDSTMTTDDDGGVVIEEEENSAPGSFSVTIGDVTNEGASISWTQATDPDGDDVTYSVSIGGSEEASSLLTTSYDIEGQPAGTALTGSVTATDPEGLTSTASFDLTTYVIDISRYQSMTGFISATLVDCSYSEGGSGMCYEIVFNANNVDDDNTHLCPETVNDVGGLGNYDGDGVDNGSSSDGAEVGFSILDAALFDKMENDGFDIIDANGNIRINDFQSGMINPSFSYCLAAAPDDALTLTFQIPVIPELLSSADNIESVEYLGLALDGTPMNGEPPSVVDFGGGNIPSLDRCGGHQDPAGYYHWHFVAQNMNEVLANYGYYTEGQFECEHIEQSATALMGYARDGFPIYSISDVDGLPTDLDACNGHSGVTQEYPDGIYHYHASTDVPNVPPCIVGKQSRDSFIKPM